MNLKSLATIWDATAPALANHLWQSTLFAVAAGLLTLLLRNNQARGRYWLWLAASVKFLVPFSVLVAIGSHLAWWHSSTVGNASFFVAVEEVSQPFTQPAIPPVPHVAPAGVSTAATSHLVPAILAGLWFCGFVTVLVSWCVRWRRVSAAVRTSVRLNEGREVEALRRVEQVAGVRKPIEMLLSRSMLEPGIFGMSRPVLIWPHGISEYLEGAHLDAVLAHELLHVRRRDNLTAAIHMAVEAIFWFYPPVWWLGARLVEERERACDEEVMQSGGERRIYAESILKVCEFCVGSPLACVSGVTGADLKKRMVHIMSEHMAQKLELSKEVLLWIAALVVVIAPIVFGLVNATPTAAQSDIMGAAPSPFTSVSVKPSQVSAAVSPDENADKAKTFFLTAGSHEGASPTYAGSNQRMVRMFYSPDGYTAANVTLRDLIEEAYGVQTDQIVGGPDWLNTARFDVQAKVDKVQVDPANREQMEQSRIENQKRLQMLLADQFKLVLSTQSKNLATYDLVIGDGGSKLQAANSADTMMGPDGRPMGVHRMMMNQSQGQVMGFAAQGASTDVLAQQLSRQLGTPVIDKTGLKGDYDFNLQWAAPEKGSSPETEAVPDATSNAALLSAVEQQLGLKLEPQSGPMQVFVIEHVVKPAEE
ncbi:MAG TPA: M56 family metallopeptidase [Terriglobales bacterium]|nr:M56 family metallopeptidase [Terriglobales bacterium]